MAQLLLGGCSSSGGTSGESARGGAQSEAGASHQHDTVVASAGFAGMTGVAGSTGFTGVAGGGSSAGSAGMAGGGNSAGVAGSLSAAGASGNTGNSDAAGSAGAAGMPGEGGVGGVGGVGGAKQPITVKFGAAYAVTRLNRIVASAASDAFYLIGTTNGPLDGVGPYGIVDTVVIKLRSDGSVGWIKQIGGSGSPFGLSVKGWDAELAASGDLVIAGLVNGRPSFRGQPLNSTFTAFVAALTPDGDERWVHLIGGNDGATEAMGVEILDDGTIAVAGVTSASSLSEQPSLGASDVFVAWLNGRGERLRLLRYGSAQEEYPTAFTSDGSKLFLASKTIIPPSTVSFHTELTRLDAA
ncbi:MAG TPA: hypothetical protein VIV60_10635, partial [Polyangiaceae bacterium]